MNFRAIWRRLPVLLPIGCVLFMLPVLDSRAETSSEIQAAGYVFAHASPVAGVFEGCAKDRQIRLQDGSVFTCAEHYVHYAFEPEARLYHDALGLNWVFAIDGHAYRGTILRLGAETSGTPRPTRGDIGLAGSHAPAAPYPPNPPLSPVASLRATQAIDPLTIASPNRRPVLSQH